MITNKYEKKIIVDDLKNSFFKAKSIPYKTNGNQAKQCTAFGNLRKFEINNPLLIINTTNKFCQELNLNLLSHKYKPRLNIERPLIVKIK